MPDLKILIVGGGIGGLATASALAQEGNRVTVVERQPDLHSSVYGVGIIQPSNALRALDAIGCAQACLDAGFAAENWGKMIGVDGEFLHPIPGAVIEGSELPPMNGITRPKLHEILTARALELDADIRYSTTFEAIEQDADGVTVALTDGTTERFDLVVGADGVRSKVRPHVLAEDVHPVYTGQSSYRLNLPRLPEIDRIIIQAGPNGTVGYVPIGPDLAYLFFNSEMERPKDDGHSLVPELREHLAPYGGLTARVREEYVTDAATIVLRPEESMIAGAPWHKGRIVLMGDAVHAITPHLGQGAAQAIEDGVVLAEVLTKHPGDLEAAFAEFTERRYERCRLVVQTSVDIGEWEMGRLPDFDNVAATNHVLEVMVQPL